MRWNEIVDLPLVIVVAIDVGGRPELLDEGTWIDGRYDRNIRIDRDTHFSDAGEDNRHAHVYGRHDRTSALVAVRRFGEASHGLGGILHKRDADALRARGFDIPASNLIEWVELPLADGDVMMLTESLSS